MKIKTEIEVSGLHTVVIDRKWIWNNQGVPQIGMGGHEIKVCEGQWCLNQSLHHRKTPEQMSAYINALISHPKRRAWIHGYTLNIVRRP